MSAEKTWKVANLAQGNAVIVSCERCDTRFQLEDARVPATGARVRCSRCKHAFLVLPPDASADQTIHAVAAEAAAREEATPAGVTDDLPAPKVPDDGDANEWQFAVDDTPAPMHKKSGPAPGVDPWRGVLEPEKPPEALELDALGSPESWSFVSEQPAPVRAGRSVPEASSVASVSGPSVPLGRVELVPPKPNVPVPALEPTPQKPPRALELAGWTLTVTFLLAILHGIDWNGAPAPRLSESMRLAAGLVANDLAVERLETRLAGPVLVVRGTLSQMDIAPRPHPARLLVRVASPDHAAEAYATPPRAAEARREGPIEGDTSSPLVPASLPQGESIPFEAWIEEPPRSDARLELRIEEMKEGTATSDPSPPIPLPSSG